MTTGEGTSAADSKHPGQRATVLQKLANGMFRLQMTDGREVVAHTALDLRMAFSRLLPGDQVLAEVSPFDPHKARICKLLPSTQPSRQPHPESQPTTFPQRELP